jgi:hypothetical protein
VPCLRGSRLGITNTEVMAGAPIPIPENLGDADLLNGVRQLASLHGTQAYCSAFPRVHTKYSSALGRPVRTFWATKCMVPWNSYWLQTS